MAKIGETHSFQITIPKRLFDYLGVLAKQSFIGASESDVVSYILQIDLEQRLKSEFHKIDIPKPD